ncbi:MAG: penicillin-binding protein 2 [Peptoniphilaceae bacterium]|nr:penicillin-binding protein 2 [Peptoniphilaceae bacterium]MDY6018023.1 penicillin-binding protein 2 [Anaerococcus sp.]
MKKNRKDENKEKKSFFQKILEKEENSRNRDNLKARSLKKTTMNTRIIFVMVFFILIFLFIVLYLVYFQLFKADSLASNDHNKRNWVDENAIVRGNIYDTNGKLLVYSQKDDNGYNKRIYNFGRVDSSFTGFSSVQYGKSGLEKSYNNQLLNLPKAPVSKLRGMIEKNGVGNNLNLTINQDIQDIAYKYLQDHTGAIVVMNPKTGEILAMVSNPTFDPNTLDRDWGQLIQNNEGPLLNRVSQGIYRPGSTFKIVTTTAILDKGVDQNYNDTGKETIQGYDIKNFGDQIFGALNLRSAFINSVNTYFAAKTDLIGKEAFKEVSESYMFNKSYDFDLSLVKSKIPFEDLNQADLAMTGFGYGKTQVTPLHMALVTSAIANDGQMMAPILVKSVMNKDGKKIEEKTPKLLSRVTSVENAQKIRDLMVGVVNEGTGKSAYQPGVQIAGKTGTADRENGSTDAWFVGFAPAYDPKISVVVILENDGSTGGEVAAPIAGAMIKDITYQVKLN